MKLRPCPSLRASSMITVDLARPSLQSMSPGAFIRFASWLLRILKVPTLTTPNRDVSARHRISLRGQVIQAHKASGGGFVMSGIDRLTRARKPSYSTPGITRGPSWVACGEGTAHKETNEREG